MTDTKSSLHEVTAVIAAYNEGPRIAEVLRVLCEIPFAKIIVVDDGSTDDTSNVVQQFPVELITFPHNVGKGLAMDAGVRHSNTDFIFFCDADVRGLTSSMVEQTIKPVCDGQVDMMIAMRNRTLFRVRTILRFIPLLGGERCVTRRLWESVDFDFKRGFMIEAALNFYAYHTGKDYGYRVFPGLSQTIKEKKYGVIVGFKARVRMFLEVVKAQALLRWNKRGITGEDPSLWWFLIPWILLILFIF